MPTHSLAVIVSAIFCIAPLSRGQHEPAHHKVLTPEQQAYQQQYQQWLAHRQQFQAQAKQFFDAEMAREKAGDCPNAESTYDFNICYTKQLDTTETNLKNFESTIHDLLAPAPQMAGALATPPLVSGEPSLTSAQPAREFESLEQNWRQYREAACTAAFHQFDGGTGGPNFELECQLKLARDHMHELDMIYDGTLHR